MDVISLLEPDPKGEFLVEPRKYFVGAMRRIVQARDAKVAAALRPMGLTVEAFRILKVGVRAGACSISNVALLASVGRHRALAEVDKLLEAGLMERRARPTNRRVIEILPTEAGRQAVQAVDRIKQQIDERVFQGLSDDALRQALRSIERVLANLEVAPAQIASQIWTSEYGAAPEGEPH
ncbi:MAG TPA: hypothetical protein VG939_02080 [Caulobacteraceae bacterium]|nr:hypothetical protein [Caulobacteraceae bacterium]